jgi:hypothetical protein
LTPNNAFTTTTLFDLTVPQTVASFFQAELVGNADIVSVQVENCAPGLPAVICGSATAPVIFLRDANFAANTFPIIAQTPLDTSNQQILLELSHPTPGTPDVFGSFAYVNGGIQGPLTTFGVPYTGLFQRTDSAQAGFLNLSSVFSVPEPSSLTLLASSIPSVLGLMWLRRRKAASCGSKIETKT